MLLYKKIISFPVGIYLFKLNTNKNTRKQCEISPKVTKKDIRTTYNDINAELVDIA